MTTPISRLVALLTVQLAVGLQTLESSKSNNNVSDSSRRIHAILGRAYFDQQDHLQRVAAIQATWGKGQNVQTHFLDFGIDLFDAGYKDWARESVSKYETAPNELRVPDEIRSSPLYNVDGHVWAIQQALTDPACNWILVGQDMLSMHVGNMRAYLSSLDETRKLVVGNRLHGAGPPPPGSDQATMVSPWGFLLSRPAAQALVENWDEVRKDIASDGFLSEHGGSTDYALSKVLGQLGASFVDTRDKEGRDRMHLWPPSRIEKNDWWDSWYPHLRIDEAKKELSPESFMFFFAGAAEISELGAFYLRGATSFIEESDAVGRDAETNGFYTARTWRLLNKIVSNVYG